MAQFYNDKINKKVSKLINFMNEKDSDLNIFISKELEKYSKTGKKLGKENFEKEFYKIYNFKIPEIEPIFKVFFLLNSEDFKNADNFKSIISNFNINNENIKHLDIVFSEKVEELSNTSYNKYISLINFYENELQKKEKK